LILVLIGREKAVETSTKIRLSKVANYNPSFPHGRSCGYNDTTIDLFKTSFNGWKWHALRATHFATAFGVAFCTGTIAFCPQA
jgi:hypothetical protein